MSFQLMPEPKRSCGHCPIFLQHDTFVVNLRRPVAEQSGRMLKPIRSPIILERGLPKCLPRWPS